MTGSLQPLRQSGKTYLLMAMICDEPHLADDGSLSVANVGADQIWVHGGDGEAGGQECDVSILVVFNTGTAIGKHRLRFAVGGGGSPVLMSANEIDATFTEPNELWRRVCVMTLGALRPGIFWIDLIFDGRLVARIPFRVFIRE